MSLRLIEMVLQNKESATIRELIKEHPTLEYRELKLSNNEVLVRILLDAEQNEPILDVLEKNYANVLENRVLILPVEATLPRIKEAAKTKPIEKSSERISREELYEDIKDSAKCTWVYLAMIMLSTVVAAVGLHNNSVAIIIGAMVIAPMLGPSIALALGTTLGDLTLVRQALLTGLAGISLALMLSFIIGMSVDIDPSIPEIASRARVGWGDIAVALASGCAGALAFTSGVSAVLIGVMVAVALLPPLVTVGLLLGAGFTVLATNALLLFLVNLICVNIAGVFIFLIQGIRPLSWWEKGRAKKATYISIGLLITMLLILFALAYILRQG